MFYTRAITDVVRRYAQIYPVVCITGPRQSGKTTVARLVFPQLPYISFENIDTRLEATRDPRAFLAKYVDNGAVFDEIQHAPELVSYLQGIVDAAPTKMGRFVITGSENFALSATVSQSLAGRAGVLTLLPLSVAELGREGAPHLSTLLCGGYPGLYQRGMAPHELYPSYIQTYIERDIRRLKAVEDLTKFQTFLKLCAGRIGQILNLNALAQDCGISHTTARSWLSILEASYVAFVLPPYYKNYSKRVIKSPKLYFYDTGLAASILGIETEAQLESHYVKGAFFENLVILEAMKFRLNSGLLPHLSYWRDVTGHEIDLVAEWGGALKIAEIKMNATYHSDFEKGLSFFLKLEPTAHSSVLYGGTSAGVSRGIALVPFASMSTFFAASPTPSLSLA